MNKKDYIEIAKIINKFKERRPYNDTENWWSNTKVLYLALADYFEREAKETITEYIEKHLGNNVYRGELKFNREQFIKNCGVTKNE